MDKKKKEEKVSFKTPQVVPVVEEENTIDLPDVHPNMIQPYSLVLGIGSVKAGKTTWINNCLLRSREDGFLDAQTYYDNTIIISNTIGNDPGARFLKQAFEVHDHYKDGIITGIVNKQKSYGEKKDMPFISLILDDILGTNMKRNNEVSFLATKYRHSNIGLMAVFSQNLKSVDTILRNNATDIIIFKQTNNKQLLQIAEEWSPFCGSIKNFLKLYYIATAGKYNFMYVKVQEGKCLRNFEQILFEDDKFVVSDEGVEVDEEIMKMADTL
jgi:hypothetical protein|tara:strand:- start:68 stop:877 length:810 start_codon:yes stop_codon:yes gene_type:complete